MPNNNSDGDVKLMNELRINDEKLTKEMYDAVLNPIEMLNVLTKNFSFITKQKLLW
ncbi:MAG: hypothetical protein ACRD8W_09850 [Nitrososphaeraceae archaeon]|jgi:hypothetical protein